MPKADTSVKWFHSDMPGAPTLRGEAGALIELLDACLISGFDPRTPDSIAVAGEVATVTLSGGSPYDKHAVVEITGASVAGLNAEWRIATSAASSFTFACPGVVNGVATGATIKRAGAGWEKAYSDVAKAAYRIPDLLSSRSYLRIDDTDARCARVRGFESMSDIDTGEAPFPTFAQLAAESFTAVKSSSGDATAVPWVVAADGRQVLFFAAWHHNAYPWSHDALRFGDAAPFDAADVHCCVISASASIDPPYPGGNSPGNGAGVFHYLGSQTGTFVSRAHDQAVGAVRPTQLCVVNSAGDIFASPVHNRLLVAQPMLLYTDGSTRVRASMPGVFVGLERPDLGSIAGLDLRAVLDDGAQAMLAFRTNFATNAGRVYGAVDIQGPWR